MLLTAARSRSLRTSALDHPAKTPTSAATHNATATASASMIGDALTSSSPTVAAAAGRYQRVRR
jgi:hypothetical protein